MSDYIETGSDGTPLSLMDVVAEEGDLTEQVASREAMLHLYRGLETCLTGQERQIILLRYGLKGDGPKRQREVAAMTGISRSYVSRIEKRALEKLRAWMDA